MTFEKPNLEKGESAEVESSPISLEQVKKELEDIENDAERLDWGDLFEITKRELDKVETAESAGEPVEEGLKGFLEEKKAVYLEEIRKYYGM